jgi:hypothetical protein
MWVRLLRDLVVVVAPARAASRRRVECRDEIPFARADQPGWRRTPVHTRRGRPRRPGPAAPGRGRWSRRRAPAVTSRVRTPASESLTKSSTGTAMRCRRAMPTKAHTVAVIWAAAFAATAPSVPQPRNQQRGQPELTAAATAVAVRAHRRSPTARSAAHATWRSAESRAHRGQHADQLTRPAGTRRRRARPRARAPGPPRSPPAARPRGDVAQHALVEAAELLGVAGAVQRGEGRQQAPTAMAGMIMIRVASPNARL